MKKSIILLAVIATLFSGCAQPTWEGQSQTEISSWRSAGVTVEDFAKYKEAKMSASDVLAWKDSGFNNVKTILDWRGKGFTAQDAQKWNNKSINLDTAKQWTKNNFSFNEAMGWMDAKFSLSDAIKNRAEGLVPNK